jgi:hypothetical protein
MSAVWLRFKLHKFNLKGLELLSLSDAHIWRLLTLVSVFADLGFYSQTHVLFHRSSSGPLAVVEAGAPAAQSKANMNNFIDPFERASTLALLCCSSSVCSSSGRAGDRRAGAGGGGGGHAGDGDGRQAATGCPKRTGLGIHSLTVKMKGLLMMCWQWYRDAAPEAEPETAAGSALVGGTILITIPYM